MIIEHIIILKQYFFFMFYVYYTPPPLKFCQVGLHFFIKIDNVLIFTLEGWWGKIVVVYSDKLKIGNKKEILFQYLLSNFNMNFS